MLLSDAHPMCSVAREGKGTIACQRNAMHQALVAVVVVYWIVQDASVIPQCEASHFPSYAAAVFTTNLMLVQPLQKACALFVAPAFKTCRVGNIHIQHGLSGFGMFANDWVRGFKGGFRLLLTRIAQPILTGP